MATLPDPVKVQCADLAEYNRLMQNLADGVIPNVASYTSNLAGLYVMLTYNVTITVN